MDPQAKDHRVLRGTSRNLGVVTLLSSAYGILFIAVATILFIFRIGIDEKMLIEVFGEDYEEYQRTTEKMMMLLIY